MAALALHLLTRPQFAPVLPNFPNAREIDLIDEGGENFLLVGDIILVCHNILIPVRCKLNLSS